MRERFLRAYEEYADALFRHCFFRVRDRETAKDLVQETFARAWDHAAKGGAIEHLRAFLYRTATNLIIDGYRKKTTDSLDALVEEGFDPASGEHERILRDAEAKEIIETFETLGPEDREILLLRFVDGWEPREIAEYLGISANTVSVRINRAVKKLHGILNITA